MRRPLIGLLAVAAVVSSVGQSQAHIEMTSPTPRYTGNTTQKEAPCGMLNDARGDNITYFEPGSTITVEWYESINHTGHYRIMFDDDGFDGFPEPLSLTDFCEPGVDAGCLADQIPDGPGPYAQQVTLPNIECSNCTLQLIQVMADKPPYEVGGDDIYYRCADIVLQAGGGGSGPTTSSASSSNTTTSGGGGAGPGPGASTGGTGGGGDGGSSGDLGGEAGGCSMGAGAQGRAPASAAIVALGLLAVGARLRRRAR